MMTLDTRANGQSVSIEPMTPAVAADLGIAFAAIDPWARYGFSPEAMTRYLAETEPGAPRYAIRVGQTLAGAIGVRWRWLRGPYLQFLGVLPAFQRDGIGQLCLAWFEGTARAAGDRNLFVAASEFNGDALAFYEHHGFRRAAVLDDLIQDGITELLLRKRL